MHSLVTGNGHRPAGCGVLRRGCLSINDSLKRCAWATDWLRTVSRLSHPRCARSADTVARVGGDETLPDPVSSPALTTPWRSRKRSDWPVRALNRDGRSTGADVLVKRRKYHGYRGRRMMDALVARADRAMYWPRQPVRPRSGSVARPTTDTPRRPHSRRSHRAPELPSATTTPCLAKNGVHAVICISMKHLHAS